MDKFYYYLNGQEVAVTFYKKEFQKTNQNEFRTGKVIKKVVEFMSNGKAMIIHSTQMQINVMY